MYAEFYKFDQKIVIADIYENHLKEYQKAYDILNELKDYKKQNLDKSKRNNLKPANGNEQLPGIDKSCPR